MLLGPYHVPGFPGTRRARLWLPRDYDPSHAHRVLLAFDGQNVFDDHGSFAGGWHLHSAVDRLATRRRRAPVLVGLDHGNDHRISELSPFPVQGGPGRLDELLEWCVATLLPSVASRANVGLGAVNVALIGSSMGGLAALYAHFRRPDAFGGVIAMSPALWVARGGIFEFVQSQPTPMFSRVYLDCGLREGRMMHLATRMAMHLASRGYPPGQFLWRPDRRGGHSEGHWRRRAPKALRFMYPA